MGIRRFRTVAAICAVTLVAAGCVWRSPIPGSYAQRDVYFSGCSDSSAVGAELVGDASHVFVRQSSSSACDTGEDASSSRSWRLVDLDGQLVTSGSGLAPSVSDDLDHIVYLRDRAYYVDPDDLFPRTNYDVVLREVATGQETVLSAGADGVEEVASAGSAQISRDGTTVVFDTNASNLLAGATSTRNVYRYDVASGAMTLVSEASGGGPADADSGDALVSADGSVVAFSSRASNLVAGDGNGESDVFTAEAGTVTKRSNATGGGDANGRSSAPLLSADGSTVVFLSAATNLVSVGSPSDSGIYAVDGTGFAELVSIDESGQQVTGRAPLSVSADGELVLFSRSSSSGPPFGTSVSLLRDRSRDTTEMVSTNADGNPLPSPVRATLSDDGRYVLLASWVFVGFDPEIGYAIDVSFVLQAAQDVRIESIAHGAVSLGSSSQVTITGAGFHEGARVASSLFDNAPNGVTFADVDVVDRTTITATMTVDPAAQAGSRQVWVDVPHPASSARTGPSAIGFCNCLDITP